jgi:hypothetical protein
MKRPTLVLFVAAAMTIGVLALTQVAPARAARDVAMEQFSSRVGDCISSASLEIAWNVVEAQIGEAKGRSGWIEEGLIYVGPLDLGARSMNADVLASDSDSAWVFRPDSKQLLGMRPLMVGGVQAYVVHEISRPC